MKGPTKRQLKDLCDLEIHHHKEGEEVKAEGQHAALSGELHRNPYDERKDWGRHCHWKWGFDAATSEATMFVNNTPIMFESHFIGDKATEGQVVHKSALKVPGTPRPQIVWCTTNMNPEFFTVMPAQKAVELGLWIPKSFDAKSWLTKGSSDDDV